MHRLTAKAMYASVRDYLVELAESGVDGLPKELQGPEEQGQGSRVKGQGVGAAPTLTAVRSLDELREQIGDCQRCGLSASRSNLVFGTGDQHARLVFVGEAPGADEDRQGEPFVGEAGGILTRLIEAMGLRRDQAYICNVLKCRPPANRNPHRDEIVTCAPFLYQQLRLIKPQVIVALGTFAAQTLLENKEPISRLRGQFHLWHEIPLMPTFHPAFLLRNKEHKQYYWDVWHDMQLVLQKLGLPVPEKGRGKGQGQGSRDRRVPASDHEHP